MVLQEHEELLYKAGDIVEIPTSGLGKTYGKGIVKQAFRNTLMVDFSGHLGRYTIDKHTINRFENVEIFGMKVVLDDTIPIDEIHIISDKETKKVKL